MTSRRTRCAVHVVGDSPAPEYPIEPRGVYVSRYLSAEGCHILYCVDRRGWRVAQVAVEDPDNWREAEKTAIAALDELDPAPPLCLLKGSASHSDKRDKRGLTLAGGAKG